MRVTSRIMVAELQPGKQETSVECKPSEQKGTSTFSSWEYPVDLCLVASYGHGAEVNGDRVLILQKHFSTNQTSCNQENRFASMHHHYIVRILRFTKWTTGCDDVEKVRTSSDLYVAIPPADPKITKFFLAQYVRSVYLHLYRTRYLFKCRQRLKRKQVGSVAERSKALV